MNHIASVCPLSREQYGFCAHRSAVTNLLEFDKIISSWDNNILPYDVITIEFCRAFDKVPHSLLLDALSAKRLHQTTLCWFNSFIPMRRQRVRINGHLSEPIDVTSDVIQRSSVGPGLFSIYIDSLLMSIVCPSFAFADDLKFTELAVSALQSSIQSDLDRVAVWSVAFHMPLSLEKCAVLYCCSNNPHRDYYCNRQLLSSILQIKDLGVLCSSDIIYAAHPGTVVTKANKVAGAILRAFRTRDPSILWQAFKSYVFPVLIYASPCWSPGLQRDSKALDRVQRSFTKRLFGMYNIS